MGDNEATLQDETCEVEHPTLTDEDWRADLMAYMGSPEDDERGPDEFTVNDAREMYPRMSESGVTKRLVGLVRQGVYTRRRAIVDGHSVWLYKKAQ